MHVRFAVALFAGLVAGCATPPPSTGGSGPFVSAVGTPFLAAFKIPTCAITVALGAPAAGFAGLMGEPEYPGALLDKHQVFRDIDNGLNHNCGGSWAIAP
jgi:hypothetical protein